MTEKVAPASREAEIAAQLLKELALRERLIDCLRRQAITTEFCGHVTERGVVTCPRCGVDEQSHLILEAAAVLGAAEDVLAQLQQARGPKPLSSYLHAFGEWCNACVGGMVDEFNRTRQELQQARQERDEAREEASRLAAAKAEDEQFIRDRTSARQGIEPQYDQSDVDAFHLAQENRDLKAALQQAREALKVALSNVPEERSHRKRFIQVDEAAGSTYEMEPLPWFVAALKAVR